MDSDRTKTLYAVDEMRATAQDIDAPASPAVSTGHALGFLNRMWKSQPVQGKSHAKVPASTRKTATAEEGRLQVREEAGWCGAVHRAEVMMDTIDHALDYNDKLRAASMNITQERVRGARRRSRRPPDPAPSLQEPLLFPAVNRPPPPTTTPKLSPLHRLHQHESPTPSTSGSSYEGSDCESDPGPDVALHKAFGLDTPPKQRRRAPGPRKSVHRKIDPTNNVEKVLPAPVSSGAMSVEQDLSEEEEEEMGADIHLDRDEAPQMTPPPARLSPRFSPADAPLRPPTKPHNSSGKHHPSAPPVSPSPHEPDAKLDSNIHSPRHGPPRTEESQGCHAPSTASLPGKPQAPSSRPNAVPCALPVNTPPARGRAPVTPSSGPRKVGESPCPPSRARRWDSPGRTVPPHGARGVLVPRKVTSTAAQSQPKTQPKPEETTYVFDVAGGPSRNECKSAELRQTSCTLESTAPLNSQPSWFDTDAHQRQGRLRDGMDNGNKAEAHDTLTRGLRECGPPKARGTLTTTTTSRTIRRSMEEPSHFGKVFSLPPVNPLDRSQFVYYPPKDMHSVTHKPSLNLPAVSTIRPIHRRVSS